MLLLVLVLVLIAFGLLVVALLTGSVLWAWVSVGVSVAAAAVLLVDWLQRRSAVRAGADAGDPAAAPVAAPVPPLPTREPAVEPATEIIPAIRPDSTLDGGPSAASAPVADGRRDERPDTRETVVMPAFAPSGSAEGPPGALDGIGPSGPNSSRSVTVGGRDGGAAETANRPPDVRDGDAVGDGDPDSETVKTAGASTRDAGAPGEPTVAGGPWGAEGPGGPGLPSAGRRPDLPPLGPDGAPPEEPRDAEAAGLVAELGDEVLVVDELPRYHLSGCPSLQGNPVIPLPAREAVELGFTPCAWCSPDRTLANRHRATAR